MKIKNIWDRILVIGCLLFFLLGSFLFLIGRKTLQTHFYNEIYGDAEPNAVTAALTPDSEVIQQFINHADLIDGVYLRISNFGVSFTKGDIQVVLTDEAENILAEASMDGSAIENNANVYFDFGKRAEVKRNSLLTLRIVSTASDETNSNFAGVWLGNKVNGCSLTVNGAEQENTLYMKLYSFRNAQFLLRFNCTFWPLLLLFIVLCLIEKRNDKNRKITPLNEMGHIFDRYTFLLHELVGRDFAVKYRRSYLGFLWVILNPLLTMIVMSSVFSYIFRLQIENYSVYLILGNIVFNCFSEATQLATQSVVGNGQMIKKVYIPKYIFPLSKVLFSFFNFLLTLIPAMIVILYYRIPFTVNYLLLPIVLIGFFLFVLGISFFLSTMQVFMRDTQYIYVIILTLWTYLTPIFYSEDSLAPQLRVLMQFNPMYIYITCVRKIMLYGTTPTVFQLTAGIVLGIVSMTIGLRYFFSKQKKFILHI